MAHCKLILCPQEFEVPIQRLQRLGQPLLIWGVMGSVAFAKGGGGGLFSIYRYELWWRGTVA